MFPKAGQTAGPNGLIFFEQTHGEPRGNIGNKNQSFFFKTLNFLKFDLKISRPIPCTSASFFYKNV